MFSIFFIFIVKDIKMKIDGIDKKIIRNLVKDARTPILSIAREAGISGAAIHQRLRKLEKSNLIDGYKMVINPKALGYTTAAFIGIFLDSSSLYSSAIKRLKEIPEVLECHYVTGGADFILKVLVNNIEEYNHFLLEKLVTIFMSHKFKMFSITEMNFFSG